MGLSTSSNFNHTVKLNSIHTIVEGYQTIDIAQYRTENIGAAWNVTTGADITITGGPNINLNP